jgi:hypothetical protein
MTIIFVIGNGKSRLSISLENLRTYGKTYGCNALYRDFTPDLLVATDRGISEEIQKIGYAHRHVFYTRVPLPDLGAKKIEYNWGWSSGPIALTYASKSNAKEIYLLGFDLSGIDKRFNNVYADTAHYKKSSDSETFYGNWTNQMSQIFEKFPEIKYYRVVDQHAAVPGAIRQHRNVSHISIEDFLKKFPASKNIETE